jgi:signal transduction histidine kinase
VSLEVPLAVNLRRRAEGEVATRSVSVAQTLSFSLMEQLESGSADVDLSDPATLRKLDDMVDGIDQRVGGRVIVVDRNGLVAADSQFDDTIGQVYLSPQRPEIEQALSTNAPFTDARFSDELGIDIMATAVPLNPTDAPPGRPAPVLGALRITQPMDEVSASVRRITLGLVAIGAAGLLAGLVIAFALALSFSRPLTQLTAAARRLGSGELETRAGDVGGATEMRELAGSFDDMAERLQSTVLAQREFVANASHQLRTPLTGMKLRLENAMAATDDEAVRRQLEAADKEVDRLADIVERLLVMARRIEREGSGEVDVAEAVAAALERWKERAERAGASIETIGGSAIAVFDRADLDQILDNLLDNAIAYAPGPIVVETGRSEGRVRVAVEDRGAGIPAEERPRVTERFYRGQGVGPAGSGLGLAIVKELAEKWGGSIVITTPPEGGTRVEIRLNTAQPRELTSP